MSPIAGAHKVGDGFQHQLRGDMREMRRSTIVLLAVLSALALAVSACGADPDDGRSPITTVENQTVENVQTVEEDEGEDEGEGGEEDGEGGGDGKEKKKEKDRGKGSDSD
jgi:hypothetical protein